MKNTNFFENSIPKKDDYAMSTELTPFFEEHLQRMLGISDEKQLEEHLKSVVENADMRVLFKKIEYEFNQYTNSNIEFSFYTWYNKNHIEFRQQNNQIFMSSSSVITLYSYYAYILFQADNLGDEQVKTICFQNILGIIKDCCLWDCNHVPVNTFEYVIGTIGKEYNYLSLAGTLLITSLCFAWLHEMAHYYLKHKAVYSIEGEIEADKLAYNIFLCILEKSKNARFDGGIYTSCFQEYTYLSPVMFLGFMQAITLVEKILYDKTIETSRFEDFVQRKELIIDYIENSDADIDTTEGNNLFGGYEASLDSFARALVATEKAGFLEKFKNGGWERQFENAQRSLKKKYTKREELSFIDEMSQLFAFECEPIAQSFIGITVGKTDKITGSSVKISNIKFNIGEVLKNAVIMSLQAADGDAVSYMLIFVELISLLYKKAKKVFTKTDCSVLLTLYRNTNDSTPFISEEDLKAKTMAEYHIREEELNKSINKLLHLECIVIIESNVKLNEKVNVRYDF